MCGHARFIHLPLFLPIHEAIFAPACEFSRTIPFCISSDFLYASYLFLYKMETTRAPRTLQCLVVDTTRLKITKVKYRMSAHQVVDIFVVGPDNSCFYLDDSRFY